MFLNILIIAKTKLLFLILKESIQEAAPVESSVITKVRVELWIIISWNQLLTFVCAFICLVICLVFDISHDQFSSWFVFQCSFHIPHGRRLHICCRWRGQQPAWKTAATGLENFLHQSKPQYEDSRQRFDRVWDEADYVVPPAENGAFFITTNVLITPNQTQSRCPENIKVKLASILRLRILLFSPF